MSKKLILFLMVLLFGSTSFLRADELTIHDGTATNSYVPVYGFYADAYLKSEMVFPAAELAAMNGGTINSMKFYSSTASVSWGAANFQVFMAESADATISAFNGPGTIVYEGALSIVDGEMNVTFATPYNYDGGNLLVGVYNTVTGSYVSASWLGETVDGASVQGYSYSSLTSVSPTQRNFLPKTTFVFTAGGPTPPPTPTGSVVVTPSPFVLGDRPTNGWMEPYDVKIQNTGEATVVINGSISNTSGVGAITLSETIEDVSLGAGEMFDFTVLANNVTENNYAEEFTMFIANRDIMQVPVTAHIYQAQAGDVVETAKNVSWSSNAYSDTPDAATIYPNYNLYGMTEMKNDVVYKFTLYHDYHFQATGGDDFIAVYNYENNLHLTAGVEPVIVGTSGIIDDEILLAGTYYMVVASNNIADVTMSRVAIPAPEAITYVAPSPENGALNVPTPITLAWEGGLNATEYQVLFGTVYPPTQAVLDWTMVDENYGSYTINNVDSNTQYFWRIKVRNSEGTVEGPVRGFTTTLVTPTQVTATPDKIFTNETTLIKWKHSSSQGFTGEITVCDGTSTSSYVPVYGLWVDDYTRSEMVYPAEMLEEMEGGDITSLTFYLSSPATAAWAPAQFNVYMMEVDATTLSTYYGSTGATVVYSGALDGTGTTMTITFDTPYTYGGGNLLLGIEEPVEGTYKSASFYGVEATGASASGYSSSSLASVTFNQRNFLPKTTFTCGGKGETRGFLGYNVYCDEVKVNSSLLTEKQYVLGGLEYNMEGHEVAVTAVYDEGESLLSSDKAIVKVSGYGKLQGTVTELISGAPIAGVNVKFTGSDEFENNVSFEGTTNANGQYTINNVKAGSYAGMATLEGNEPAYTDGNVTVENTGTTVVDFVMHEVYNPVMSVVAEEMDSELARVRWSMNVVIPVPTPGGGGGGGQTGGDEFFENFDNSAMPTGWTSIDGDGDGYNWKLASVAMGTGYGHNGSTDCILSQSYDNNYGVLYPDNYLVTPQVTLGSNATFSFFACAQDAGYAAEHFGVAVSTTGNAAADFTMVQEWTMTAKGSGVMAPGRDGQTRAQGNWYEKTVDLSAYAGQQVYIAIRHFNCSDMFYLDVDDISLSNGTKDRSVETYAVYRKAILKENALVAADSVYFGNVTNDTLYADFTWANMEPGLYQYGVSAHYPEPAKGETREEVIIGESTGTSSYLPAYNLYNYSCTNQIYTAEEIGGAGNISSIAFFPTTVNANSRNIDVYMVNTDKTAFSGATDWVPVTDADRVFSGTVAWTANDWSTIALDTPFAFDGTNLCVVVNDLTGSWTSSNSYQVFNAEGNQALRIYQDSAPYNPAAPGNGTTMSTKNVIKLDITYGGSGNNNPITPITWSNILPKDMATTVTVNAHVAAGTAEGATVQMTNAFENLVYTATIDETGTVVFEDFRKGNYVVTVDLEGYTSDYVAREVSIWEETEIDAVLTEICKPVDAIAVSKMGYASWTPVIPVDRIPERYMVKLDNTLYAETTDNFIQFENLTVGQTYTAAVAVVYSTGMSAYVSTTFTYTGCEGATQQVEGLTAASEPGDLNVILAWNGATPTPPTPPTPPTGETYTFESGLQGWTSIDADGDGYNWSLGSSVMGTGYGHNGSSDLVLSQSYDNNYGVLYPDNYLVSPAKAAYTGISFYACAQDAGYAAEHFGVAVSTTTATASAFTMVQEWTMTAKGSGVMAPGRDGQTRAQGNWYEYTVDLSAYAGQEIWIAIRHFNCSDMFYLDVDDITLGGSSKLAEGTLANAGMGFGAAASQMTRDWYYYDSGTNSDAIGLTSGGGFYWGIMVPAGSYEGNRVTKVAYFDYAAHTGSVMIYNGGTSAPGTLLYTQSYSVNGTQEYIEIEMGEAVEVDNTQNLWVVMHNNNGQYVAAIDETSYGVANGSCISIDGSEWYNTVSSATSGQIDGNWNLRVFVEAGSGPAPSDIVPNKFNVFVDGELVGAVSTSTFTYAAPDYASHEYKVVWVDSDYTMSCEIEDVNIINYAAQPLAIDENSIINAIYPNPTSGDLHINATAMKHITVFNAMGQVVYTMDVNADETVIDMAKFEAGVYMVSVITENGTTVKRVTVVK